MAEKFDFKPIITDTPAAGSGSHFLRNCTIGCIGLIAIVTIFLSIAISSSKSTPHNGSGYEAQKTCERAIEQILKSPSTAEFSSQASGSGPYDVTGTVDSENGFGAMLRSSFGCTVTFSGGNGSATVDYFE